jgi:hypothetical protein
LSGLLYWRGQNAPGRSAISSFSRASRAPCQPPSVIAGTMCTVHRKACSFASVIGSMRGSVTICTSCPSAVPTRATPSAMVPEELSTIGASGLSSPRSRADRMTCRATRSFIANRFCISSFA